MEGDPSSRCRMCVQKKKICVSTAAVIQENFFPGRVDSKIPKEFFCMSTYFSKTGQPCHDSG